MKDIARRAEIMGVEAKLSREKDGSVRIALPAFAVGEKGGADVYYWAGSLKDGKVVSCYFEVAQIYLTEAAKLPADALPSESL
jgi:hypothetical protein